MRLHLKLRFDYGSSIPWVTRLEDDSGLSAIVGPNRVVLRTPVELRGESLATVAEFSIVAGECVPFVLTHRPSHLAVPEVLDWQAALRETEDGWRRWCGQCCYHGPWKEAVQRSLLTLKALTDAATGGIIAAPTTSLPEQLGGARNWDYRYCWLRDATPCPTSTYAISRPSTRRRCFWYGNAAEIMFASPAIEAEATACAFMKHSFQVGGARSTEERRGERDVSGLGAARKQPPG